MLTRICLLTCVVLQSTLGWATLDDESATSSDELKFTKRYLGALAKNNKLPVQHRSYMVPPMVSSYGNNHQQQEYADEPDPVYKRYLGALARSGNLKVVKPPQKRSLTSDELDESRPNAEELQNPTVVKQEMIENLKEVIVEFLNDMNKQYDPRKVDLFLENLVNTIYDQNDEISLDSIKALVKSDYFLPEDTKDGKIDILKRNIQSLVRGFNVSYSGITPPSSVIQMRQGRDPQYYHYYYTPSQQYDVVKRNLQALMKSKSNKRYVGAMAKNANFPTRPSGKRDSVDEPIPLEYVSENVAPQFGIDDDGEGFFRNMGKRHTMYDINEPDITFEYPSQAGEQNDYNDYAEQMGQEAPIPIGKRYLGALARSGWLPHGFALRSPAIIDSGYENKRHIGALARLGWLQKTVHESPNYYYRGGRGRDFRPPSFRGPKAFFLKSDIEPRHCQCKRDSDTSWSESSWPWPRSETPADQNSPRTELPTGKSASVLEKRFLLIPAVDYFILRSLYPHLIRRPLTGAN